jgi:predicted amidohydrolase YtcJ
MTSSSCFAVLALIGCAAHAVTYAAEPPADMVYRNGFVYTVDEKESVTQALAVRAGRIVYVGDNAGAKALIGKATKVIDLHGRMLMPGLIDGHMHPQSGGSRLLNCSLNYEPLPCRSSRRAYRLA